MKTMVFVGNSEKGGVGAFLLYRERSKLEPLASFMPDLGLAPLAVSPNGRFLYAGRKEPSPEVFSFAVDAEADGLYPLNSVPVPAAATYLSVDVGGRFLLGASYGGDAVFVMALGPNGMVQENPVQVAHPGRNPHCVVPDHSNRFVYVPLLGNDRIAQYRFDASTGALLPNSPPVAATCREAGPRHLLLSPDNRFAYLLTELSGEIVSFAVDQETGTLTALHSVPLLPPEHSLPRSTYTPPRNRGAGGDSPTPVMWAADIRITPDGRFLYASERTNSTLSCFRVDPVSGRLDFQFVMETEAQPRGFRVDPFGECLIVAGERSDHVSLYALNRETGGLVLADRREVGEKPNWVEVVAVR